MDNSETCMNCDELFELFTKLGGRLECNQKENSCKLNPKIFDNILQEYKKEQMTFEPSYFSCNNYKKNINEFEDLLLDITIKNTELIPYKNWIKFVIHYPLRYSNTVNINYNKRVFDSCPLDF